MKYIYKLLVVLTIFSLALTFSSCKKNDIIVISGERSVLEGEQISLKIETKKSAYTADWSSTNPEIASVNNYGVVTGIREGTTTVRVTIGDKYADALITVNKFIINISSDKYLHIGDTTKVIVTHNSKTEKEIFFNSTHSSIATIDNEGNILAISLGSTVITVTVGGFKSNFILTVLDDGIDIPVDDPINDPNPNTDPDPIIDPEPIDDPKPVYESLKIDVPTFIKYDDAIFAISNKEVVWTSYNSEILMFGEENEIIPMTPGRVKIRATDINNSDAFVEKEVYVIISDIKPNEIEIYTESGSNVLDFIKKEGYVASILQLYVRAINSDDNSDETVIWMVDNENIATINDLGVLSAIKIGRVTITAVSVLDATVSATYTIDIVMPKGD